MLGSVPTIFSLFMCFDNIILSLSRLKIESVNIFLEGFLLPKDIPNSWRNKDKSAIVIEERRSLICCVSHALAF